MAIEISDLKVFYSGGTTNTSPDSSLGGQMTQISSAEVISQICADPTFVTGVTIKNAFNNPVGTGSLKWDPNSSDLSWKPPSGVQYVSENITTDGIYVVGNSSGYIVCDVVVANLANTLQEDTDITVTNKMNNVFDSVSSTEALDGRIEYRCLYIKNTHAADTAYDVRIWVKQQPVGPDELDIALDPAGIGDGDTTGVAIGPLADEIDSGNLLSGITWSRPTTQDAGLVIGTLAPGECHAFWEKRTVAPNTVQQVANDTSKIGISVLL